jgi:hypothetical protein
METAAALLKQRTKTNAAQFARQHIRAKPVFSPAAAVT